MYKTIKKFFYISLFLAFFLVLNNNKIFANNPGNELNYNIEINNGVKSTLGDLEFFYINEDIIELQLDQKIINSTEIDIILIAEQGYDDEVLAIYRENGFTNPISYLLKNKSYNPKGITILMFRDPYKIEAAKWISTININLWKFDPLEEDSFALRSDSYASSTGTYEIRIEYKINKHFKIKSFSYYLDPDINNKISLPSTTTSFNAPYSGYYYIIIEDIFANIIIKPVLAGYGRIDEVIIFSNDELIQKLGENKTITFNLDLKTNGISIVDTINQNVLVSWFIDGVLYRGSIGEGYSKYIYNVPNDRSKLGNHEIYVTVDNKYSNTMNFTIINNERPTITLSGSEFIYLEAKVEEYIEYGAVATDDIDGNISQNINIDFSRFAIQGLTIVTLGNINNYFDKLAQINQKTGSYHITYSVVDQHGNEAFRKNRLVYVRDTLPPEITIIGEEELFLEYQEEYIELGATAYDIYEGAVTVIIDGSSLKTDTIGTYKIRYSATDSKGNYAFKERKVTIGDNEKPLVTLNGGETIYLDYMDRYQEAGARVSDNVDGIILYIDPNKIIFNSKDGSIIDEEVDRVDTFNLGTYHLEYFYMDTSGNKSETITRTVIVDDYTAPTIYLLGGRTHLKVYDEEDDEPYTDPGYYVVDNYDTNLDGDVVISYFKDGNEIELEDIKNPGMYIVNYNVSDRSGNVATEVVRTLFIINTDEPGVVLKGVADVYYEAFSDLDSNDFLANGIYGYYFEYNFPENLELTISIYNNNDVLITNVKNPLNIHLYINTNYITTYKLVYSAKDGLNESVHNPERFIHIRDTTAPIINVVEQTISKDLHFNKNELLTIIENNASAYDIYDNYHLKKINITFSEYIDTSRIGTYRVTYYAKDSSDNSAEPVSILVEILDNDEPSITLVGDQVVLWERGRVFYDEYGAVAIDNYDGRLTIRNSCEANWDSVNAYVGCFEISSSDLTGMKKGEYYITYHVKDSSGNYASATRTIRVIDTIAPTATGFEENKSNYNYDLNIKFEPTPGTDEVLSAVLNGRVYRSGDYITQEGEYELIVWDDFNNTTVYTFKIDKTPPTILNISNGQFFNVAIKEIKTNEEIDLIEYVYLNETHTILPHQVNFNKDGRYQIRVRDLAGNWSYYTNFITFNIDRIPPDVSLSPNVHYRISNGEVFLLVNEPELEIFVNNNPFLDVRDPFTKNGYYKIRAKDRAGNITSLQFVLLRQGSVVNVDDLLLEEYIALDFYNDRSTVSQGEYKKGSGYIIAYPRLDGTFEFIRAVRFSDAQLEYLKEDDLVLYHHNINTKDTMAVVFIVEELALSEFIEKEESLIVPIASGVSVLALLLFILLATNKNKRRSDVYTLDNQKIEILDETITKVEEEED